MLGRFLELSVQTADIRASLDFYERLGFSAAEVGEAWPHPYAVVTDGRLHVGLHQAASQETANFPGAALTFVKPDLLASLDEFESLGVQFEFRRLGNDVFNEVGWFDPSGHLIRLVEARTFSPAKRQPGEIANCGYFLEIGLPAAQIDLAKSYWERLGFIGMAEPNAHPPHICCMSDTIDLGLYDPADLRRPTLLFDADDPDACITHLRERGIEPSAGMPAALRGSPGALLIAPEGTPIIIASLTGAPGLDASGIHIAGA
jgi:catechol 2,3-dioxygenase-like lactoylglutathione lyase family enzyme